MKTSGQDRNERGLCLCRKSRLDGERGTIAAIELWQQMSAEEASDNKQPIAQMVFHATPATAPHHLMVAKESGSVEVWNSDGTLIYPAFDSVTFTH